MVTNFINDPKDLTQKELKSLLDYNEKTGVFYWKVDRNQYIKKGSWAGQRNPQGYIRINVKGRKTYAHRLAWLYMYGKWPEGEIDHINDVPWDNAIKNLQVIPRDMNILKQNSRSNKTNDLPMGVTIHSQTKKYWARFRQKSLGLFDDLEEAVKAYKKAKSTYIKESVTQI